MGQIENTEGIKFQICRKSKSICFSLWIKSLKIVGVKTLPERTESEKLKLVLVYPLKPFKKIFRINMFGEKILYFDWIISTTFGWVRVTFRSDIQGPQRMNSGESGDPLRFTFFGFERKTITCIAMTFSTDVHALQACSFTFGEYDFIGRGISLAPKCFIFTGMRLVTILPLSKIN